MSLAPVTRVQCCWIIGNILQDVAILVYKVNFKLIAANISNIIDLFSVSLSSYNLRNSDFFIPRFNTVKYGRQSIRYLGPFFMVQIV